MAVPSDEPRGAIEGLDGHEIARSQGPAAANPRLDAELRRWQSAGLLTADQVAAILTFERRRPADEGTSRSVTLVEVLAYLGVIVALVGVLTLLGSRYQQLGSAGRVSVMAVVMLVSAGAAILLGRRAPGLAGRRARSAAFGLANLSLAALVFQVQLEQAGGGLAGAVPRIFLVGAALGSAVAVGLLAWTGSGVIAFLLAVGVYVSAQSTVAMQAGPFHPWPLWGVYGAAGALLVIAAEAARQRRLRWPPEVLAFAALLVPVIVAYLVADQDLPLELLGGVISLAGFGAAVVRSSGGYAIAGAMGIFGFVLDIELRHFENSLGFAVILVTSGLALVGIAYLTARLLPRVAEG